MSSTSLVSELERLAEAIGSQKSGNAEISLPTVAERIAKSLGVRNEEVAILALSTKWRHPHFLVPQSLKNVGFIPVSSPSALAARAVRENRAEIDNRFHETRHARVFEGVKADILSAEAIQKIVSVPIPYDGEVTGVLQISRKRTTAASAGIDFALHDVEKIATLCRPLGKLLQHFADE